MSDTNGHSNGATVADSVRERWACALRAAPRARVIELGEALASRHGASFSDLPRNGLALLRGRDSVSGQRWNIGEVPLSVARVRLLSKKGGPAVEGGAAIMADDARLAAAIAVCDAVLAHDLGGAPDVRALAELGDARRRETERRRAMMRARTRTDFALLGDADAALNREALPREDEPRADGPQSGGAGRDNGSRP